MVSFTLLPLYIQGNRHRYLLCMRLSWSKNQCGSVGEKKIGNRTTIPPLSSLSPSHSTDYANPAPNAMGNYSYLRFLDNAYQIPLTLHTFIRPSLVRCTAVFFHPQRSFSTCPCLQYPFISVHGLSYSLILQPSIFICVQSGSPCGIPFDKPFPCIPLTRFPAFAAL